MCEKCGCDNADPKATASKKGASGEAHDHATTTSMLTARFIAIPTIIRRGIRITTSIRRPAQPWRAPGRARGANADSRQLDR